MIETGGARELTACSLGVYLPLTVMGEVGGSSGKAMGPHGSNYSPNLPPGGFGKNNLTTGINSILIKQLPLGGYFSILNSQPRYLKKSSLFTDR
jgi:hypothetical protein